MPSAGTCSWAESAPSGLDSNDPALSRRFWVVIKAPDSATNASEFETLRQRVNNWLDNRSFCAVVYVKLSLPKVKGRSWLQAVSRSFINAELTSCYTVGCLWVFSFKKTSLLNENYRVPRWQRWSHTLASHLLSKLNERTTMSWYTPFAALFIYAGNTLGRTATIPPQLANFVT